VCRSPTLSQETLFDKGERNAVPTIALRFTVNRCALNSAYSSVNCHHPRLLKGEDRCSDVFFADEGLNSYSYNLEIVLQNNAVRRSAQVPR